MMKSIKTLPLMIALIAFVFSAFSNKQVFAQPQGSVSFDLFYNELSPYGHWDRDPAYGDIWFPSAEANFRPYGTNGYWTMTEYGNTWVSNYEWGWAPFHYGRWVHTSYRGWGWIPGYEWGPAWVDWRSGGGYYGWAPMPPAVGVTVSVGVPLNLWVFLPSRRIYDPYIHRHWTFGQRAVYNRTTIINNTYIVNNNRYYGGPARADVERQIGRRVAVRNVRTTERPGRSRVDNRSVSIYRPDRATNTRSSQNTARTAQSNSNTRAAQSNTGRPERYIGNNPARNSSTQRTTENQATRSNTTSNRAQNQNATRARSQQPNTSSQQRNEATRKATAQPQQNNRSNVPQRATPDRSQSNSRNSQPRQQPTPSRAVQQTSQRSSSPTQVSRAGSSSSTTSRVQRSTSSSSRGSATSSSSSSRSSTRGSR